MEYNLVKKDLENIIMTVKPDITNFDENLSFSDMGINSLMYIRILVMLEEKYNIHLDEDVVKKGINSFESVSEFAYYLSKKYD